MSDLTDYQSILSNIGEQYQSDIIIYSGEINYKNYEKLCYLFSSAVNKEKNIYLILRTYGGDAHLSYKIAFECQNYYNKFYLYNYGFCKRAAMLLAVASDHIIMNINSEFGPLDIHLPNKEEILGQISGLDVFEALEVFKVESCNIFMKWFRDLTGSGLSAKNASEISMKMTNNFISPILSQVPPQLLGATKRSQDLCLAYGERLIQEDKGNITIDSLADLVSGYTNHDFVIKYFESNKIFKSVSLSSCNELELINKLDKKFNKNEDIVQKLFIK